MQGSIRKVAAALGVAVLGTLSFSAFANASSERASVDVSDPYVRQAEVSYSDLDLNRLADATTLYRRIERTARSVCRTENGPSAHAHQIELECIRKAIGGAVDDVGNANLTAVHVERAGKRSMVASSR